MKYDIKGKESFFEKYDDVSPYTMSKLAYIYGESEKAEISRIADILKASACGLLTLFSTVLPVYMLNNPELIRNNLFESILFGIGGFTLFGAGTIKFIRDYKKDNNDSNKYFNQLEKERIDIPMSLIRRKYREMCDEGTEFNKMIKNSNDSQYLEKFCTKVMGK